MLVKFEEMHRMRERKTRGTILLTTQAKHHLFIDVVKQIDKNGDRMISFDEFLQVKYE